MWEGGIRSSVTRPLSAKRAGHSTAIQVSLMLDNYFLLQLFTRKGAHPC